MIVKNEKNPLININFNWYFLYNNNIEIINYFIKVNDDFLVFFNLENQFSMYGVKNNTWYSIFNTNWEYIYHLQSTPNENYNIFNLENEWIWFTC